MKFMDQSFTKEEIAILKAISHNHEGRFQDLLNSGRERLDRIFAQYRQTEPVLDDLEKNGIKINDLEEPYPALKEDTFRKAIPILLKWLKKESLPYHAKASIIKILIQRPIAKEYTFDTVLDIFKFSDPNYRDEWGAQTTLPVRLGNALLRWLDDEHAPIIFDLLKEEKFRKDEFLLQALANFKKPENKKKAAQILMQQLQKPNWPNIYLGTIIYTLGKLKALEARSIIESFTNFPANYKRTREISRKEHNYLTDKQIQNDAKKVIAKFNKLQNNYVK